jgi:Zinc finger, C3HC4 type (RING finger)
MYYINYTRKIHLHPRVNIMTNINTSTYYTAPNRVRDIRVKIGDTWRPADEAQKAAYIAYKSRAHYYTEMPHTHENGITIFREDNDPYMATYFKLEGSARNAKHPIIDINDISVFLMAGVIGNGSRDGAGWVNARNYQAWAYADFVYDHVVRKCYMSKYSTYLAFPPGFDRANVVTIDIDDLPPNIIFSVSRNENNSVYYERNDSGGSRVRICDNEYARVGFLGFFTRITMDVGMIIEPPGSVGINNNNNNNNLSNGIICEVDVPPLIETSVEEDQCILCYEYVKNTKLSPCNHVISCYRCILKLSKPECPVCKARINSISNP